MTKKSIFGGKDKDEAEIQADKEADAAANRAAEVGADPKPAASGKLPVPHGETNPETVGTTEVNPHNEAAAQRPATLPNQAFEGRIQGRPIEQIDALSDADKLAHLRGWGQDVRLGGPRSADWELFDKIVGEDPEKKRVREAQDEAQRRALSGERAGEVEARRPGESDAEYEARRLAARPERDRP